MVDGATGGMGILDLAQYGAHARRLVPVALQNLPVMPCCAVDFRANCVTDSETRISPAGRLTHDALGGRHRRTEEVGPLCDRSPRFFQIE